MGIPIDDYVDGLAAHSLLRLKPVAERTEEELKQEREWKETKKKVNNQLKGILYTDAYSLVKLNLGILFTGWHPRKRKWHKGKKVVPEKHFCKCNEHLTHEHA